MPAPAWAAGTWTLAGHRPGDQGVRPSGVPVRVRAPGHRHRDPCRLRGRWPRPTAWSRSPDRSAGTCSSRSTTAAGSSPRTRGSPRSRSAAATRWPAASRSRVPARVTPATPMPNLHLGVRLDDAYVDPLDYLSALDVSALIRLAPLARREGLASAFTMWRLCAAHPHTSAPCSPLSRCSCPVRSGRHRPRTGLARRGGSSRVAPPGRGRARRARSPRTAAHGRHRWRPKAPTSDSVCPHRSSRATWSSRWAPSTWWASTSSPVNGRSPSTAISARRSPGPSPSVRGAAVLVYTEGWGAGPPAAPGATTQSPSAATPSAGLSDSPGAPGDDGQALDSELVDARRRVAAATVAARAARRGESHRRDGRGRPSVRRPERGHRGRRRPRRRNRRVAARSRRAARDLARRVRRARLRRPAGRW